jgi:hypothetical protein
VRGLLSSPRRRRRTLWGGLLLLVAAAAGAVGVIYPNTAEDEKPTYRNEPIQEYREPATVRLTRNDRTLALTTAMKFVDTAVARRHVDRSWELVAPGLRQGYTRRQWLKGEIPVVPFPAAEARVKVDYSYRNQLGLTMLLLPPRSSGERPATFNMDLTAIGTGAKRHWLVNAFTPRGITSQQATPARSSEGSAIGAGDLAPAQGSDPPLSAAWIIVPLALLGSVLLVPATLMVRSVLQNRRAMREFEASRRS